MVGGKLAMEWVEWGIPNPQRVVLEGLLELFHHFPRQGLGPVLLSQTSELDQACNVLNLRKEIVTFKDASVVVHSDTPSDGGDRLLVLQNTLKEAGLGGSGSGQEGKWSRGSEDGGRNGGRRDVILLIQHDVDQEALDPGWNGFSDRRDLHGQKPPRNHSHGSGKLCVCNGGVNFFAGGLLFHAYVIDKLHHYIKELRIRRKTMETAKKQGQGFEDAGGSSSDKVASLEEEVAKLRARIKQLESD
ncbi:hypothetical protein V6N13_078362 [Hibiscus sabdariffa]